MTYHRLGAVVLTVSALALIGVAVPAAPAVAAVDCSTTAPFDPRVGAIQPANGTLSTSFRVTVQWTPVTVPAGCTATVVIALSTVAGAAPPPGPVTVPAAAGSATVTVNAPARYAFQAQLVVDGAAGPWSPAQQFTVLPLDYCLGWVRPPSSSPVSGQALDATDALLSVDVGPQDPLHVTLCGAPTAIATAVGDSTAPIVRFPAGTTTSAVAAGLTPGRTYRWQVYVNDTVYGTVTITQPPAPGGCQVDLRVTAAWSTYHVISGTVTAGSAALTGWRVSWPANGTVTQVWNAVLGGDPTAQVTTVGNAPYNGAVPAGQTATFGFVVDGGTWGGVTPAGLTCAAATS